jgi:hypothetical protein
LLRNGKSSSSIDMMVNTKKYSRNLHRNDSDLHVNLK